VRYAFITLSLSTVVVLSCLTCVWAPRALAQEDGKDSSAAGGPDLEALCDDLELEFSDWEDRDEDSIFWILGTFETRFSEARAADQKRIVAAVKKILSFRPTAENNRVQTAAVQSLTKMGKQGRKTLQAALKKLRPPAKVAEDDPRVVDYLKQKAALIRAIGTFADTKTLKILFEALDADESEIINAAAKALGCFHETPLSQRKPIVERLIKRYVSLAPVGQKTGRKAWEQGRRHGRKVSDERFHEISTAMNRALVKLTGQDIYHTKTWQIWWQAHKKDRKWERQVTGESGRCPLGHGEDED